MNGESTRVARDDPNASATRFAVTRERASRPDALRAGGRLMAWFSTRPPGRTSCLNIDV
jgi:hypothetical protein